MSDAAALDWLDRLLAADEPGRRSSLEALAAADPELHARLQRLLAHALAPENSIAIAGPVLAGVTQLSIDATRTLQPGDILAGYRLIHELGRVNYEVELADCHWGVYQMLGKLLPTLYILAKQ